MKKLPSKELQAIWKKKLKDSKFIDLEGDDEYGLLRTTTTSGGVIDKRRSTWEIQQEYFKLATYFLNDYKFKSHIERIIWEYHSNGISTRDIANTLNKVRKKRILRMTVWRTVKRLAEEMKKMYGVK